MNETFDEPIGLQARADELIDLSLDNDIDPLIEYIDMLVKNAYIAGYQNSRQLGLNIPVEERADEYCKLKGLRL